MSQLLLPDENSGWRVLFSHIKYHRPLSRLFNGTLVALFLYSYAGFPGVSAATQDTANGSVRLLSNTLESDFSVIGNRLKIIKGGSAQCAADNDYMNSALQVKNILLTDSDYRAHVSTKVYVLPLRSKKDTLELVHYEIHFLSPISSVEKLFSMFEGKEFLPTHVQLSEAPIRCYAFTGAQTLHLICHYGFQKYRGIGDIINSLK